MAKTQNQTLLSFDFRKAADNLLKNLRRDRDRQILARRFGFDMTKRHTLESIGQDFGITRERVRQIEKAAITKIRKDAEAEIKEINLWLGNYLKSEGHLSLTSDLAIKMGAIEPKEHPYVNFLATVAPGVDILDDDDTYHAVIGTAQHTKESVRQLITNIVATLKKIGQPVSLEEIAKNLPNKASLVQIKNAAKISRQITSFENKWGLTSWPEVNPKSIRDKTYIILSRAGKPMHFRQIAEKIQNFSTNQRHVTVQAVHNELIKDARFVLIGRGIYALAEWGYAPGTVADMIGEVLTEESPLHKDEIVRRVLARRQVKPTTIILNLQEKNQFERVAKATYKLRSK